MNIVCWLDFPYHYYTGIFRVLSEIWPGKVIVVFASGRRSLYKTLELEHPAFGKVLPIFLDQEEHPKQKIAKVIEENLDAIHISQGFNPPHPFFQMSIQALLAKNPTPKWVPFTECPQQYQFCSGLAREFKYRYYVSKYRNRVSAVLALGNMGAAAYHRYGFDKKIIFPMSYCVDQNFFEPQSINTAESCEEITGFILVAGMQCFHRKGIDVLIQAFSKLRELDWRCSILGFDPERKFQRQLEKAGIESKLAFLGRCKNTEVLNRISQNDILVLPSRHDGWGVSLAEGIFSGLGGIASDRVASSDLIKSFNCGRIVPSGDVAALADALRFCIENKQEVQRWKNNALQYRHLLLPEQVGLYVKQVLEYMFINPFHGSRPIPPWEQK